MASAIDISNLALAHLGDSANVAAISPPDGSAQSKHCARFYPIARDALLEMHTWSFAKRRASLSLLDLDNISDGGELPESWGFGYAWPSDCLKPIAVLLPGATDDTDGEDFVTETLANGTKVIFTNAEDATLVYTKAITDTTKFSPLFVNALARLLASYLAGPIIKGVSGMQVSKAMMQMFMVEYGQAAAVDANAQQKNAYEDFTPSSIKARA